MQDPRAHYAHFTYTSPAFRPELVQKWNEELAALSEFAGKTFHFKFGEKTELEQHRSALPPATIQSMSLFLRPAVAGFVRMARLEQ